MTNKQIIIDGVDVSKCSYFQQEDDEYTCGAEECNGAIVACRACDNCYYKQLKRKEQECERLKEKLCSFENCTNFEKYGKEIAKLKQTLNEIKQIAIREFETSRYNGSFTWKQILQKISECEGNDE